MIKLTVKRAALKRRIKTAYQLAQRFENAGGRPPSPRNEQLARRLWKGEKLPKLETIDLAAGALGDCDLSELIVRTPDRRRKPAPPKGGRNGNGHQ